MDDVDERRLTLGPTAAPDSGGEHALDLGQGEANQRRDNLIPGSILPTTLLLVVFGHHCQKIRGASSA